MGGGGNSPLKANIDSLVTLLVEGGGAERIWLTDEKCKWLLTRIAEDESAVVSLRDPIGRAVFNRTVGDSCEYLDEDRVKVAKILAVDPGPVL